MEAPPSCNTELQDPHRADSNRQNNAAEPQKQEAREPSAHTEGQPASTAHAKQGAATQKHRPRAKPRANSAQQKAALESSIQQQDAEALPDEGQDRFKRMMQESGVTAEDWAEEGVY